MPSVTGCSTCSRVFISRKKKSPVVVGQELDGARAGVADRLGGQPRPPRTACSRIPGCARPAATAPPRRSSGGGAGSSIRARRPPTPCRARRPSPGPRRGGRWPGSARRTPSGRRTPTAASRRAASTCSGSSARSRTTRMPRPPPPADALISTGSCAAVTVSGIEFVEHRHPGGGHQLLGLDLRAHRLDRGDRRADPGQPGVLHGARRNRRSRTGIRSRGGWRRRPQRVRPR